MAKVLFIAPYAKFYEFFCWDLLEKLVHEGHEVIAIAPDKDQASKFNSIGVDYKYIPLKNTGTNPIYDILSIYNMKKVLTEDTA